GAAVFPPTASARRAADRVDLVTCDEPGPAETGGFASRVDHVLATTISPWAEAPLRTPDPPPRTRARRSEDVDAHSSVGHAAGGASKSRGTNPGVWSRGTFGKITRISTGSLPSLRASCGPLWSGCVLCSPAAW